MPKFFTVLASIIFFFSAGCATGSFGTVRYSHVFQPVYTIDVVNNTTALLDVEYGGELVKPGLTPGETFSYPVWNFRHGDQIHMTVKGRHRDGGEYLGIVSRRFNLRTSYTYRGGIPRRHEVWVVNRLQAPTIY